MLALAIWIWSDVIGEGSSPGPLEPSFILAASGDHILMADGSSEILMAVQ